MVIFRQVQNENGNSRSYRNSYRECKKKNFLNTAFKMQIFAGSLLRAE